jgi:hypothetical protein
VKHLIKFFYTANVALMGIENKDLRASFQTLGVDLPGRTNLSGSSLDETHAEVRTQEQGSRAGKKKQSEGESGSRSSPRSRPPPGSPLTANCC